MLPFPELDDQRFQEIVEDARRMIPQLYPGWTDENYHDPGITLIEMLAWLTEMQQFYLNQITQQNELKFLKLMGIRLRSAVSARTDVTFSEINEMILMPVRSRLAAGDQLFETTEPLWLLPSQIEKVLVFNEKDYREFTSFNETPGLFYYAFGREAKKGNKLLIGFDQELPVDKELSLALHLYEDYPVKPGPLAETTAEFYPPARVTWQYYGREGWRPLKVLFDESGHFSRSGRIKFVLPETLEAVAFGAAEDSRLYWIGCILDDDVLEIPPRVEEICLNTVPAVQQSTLSEICELSSNGDTALLLINPASSLALYGINELQVKDENDEWVFWREVTDFSQAASEEKVFSLKRTDSQGIIIQFRDVPPAGSNNIRLVSCHPDFYEQRWLGQSSGLPGQTFELPLRSLLKDGFVLQVGREQKSNGEMRWQDWQLVDDFDASGSSDRHFVLDEDKGLIQLGNNENGFLPDREERLNILILSAKIGGGLRGNVKENEITRLTDDKSLLKSMQVSNRRPACSGSDKETLADAHNRLKAERKKPNRAVTAEDFEALALITPGLRVARVKAVPLYKPGMRNYPEKTAEGQITVAVMPYSQALTPIPSIGFRQTVLQHLNRYRLLGTEVHVADPDYVKVSVYASVVITPGTVRAQEKIVQELDRFLQPLDRDNLSSGWPFGHTVYRGDIYEVINQITGVEYVKELWLVAEGKGIRREFSGDVELPPCGLVYPGEHEIEIINRNDL